MEGFVEASDDLEEGEIADSDDESTTKPTAFPQPKTSAAVNAFGGTTEQRTATLKTAASVSSNGSAARVDTYRVPRKDSSDDSDSDDEETGCSAMLLKSKRMRYVASHQGDFQNPLLAKHRLECGDGADVIVKTASESKTMEMDIATRHKNNNVWGNLLQEDQMMQTISSVTVDKPDRMIERDVESYGYNKRYDDLFNDDASSGGEDTDDTDEDDEKKNDAEVTSLCDKETFGAISAPAKPKPRRNVKDRLGKVKSHSDAETDKDQSRRHHRKRTASDPRSSTSNIYDRLKERTYDKSKSRDHLSSTGSDSIEQVVTTLINVLQEPADKQNLLVRLVEVIGTKKSMELLYMTEDIESAGGLMTVDGSRRRTAGGVYFSLLKSHPGVTSDQMGEIFKDEREIWKKQCKARKRKHQRNAAKMHSSGDKIERVVDGTEAKNGMDTQNDDDIINDAAAEEIHLDIG